MDTRFLSFLIWGVGCLVVYSIVLYQRQNLESAALWIVSLASFCAIALVLFGPAGTGIRGWFVAVALGAFAATGLVMATRSPRRRVNDG